MRGMLLLFVSLSLAACIPPQTVTATATAPRSAKTTIEKTTVTVRDAQGNIMRIEEKEMVLQDYEAGAPVEMKQAKSPPLTKVELQMTVPAAQSSTRMRGR